MGVLEYLKISISLGYAFLAFPFFVSNIYFASNDQSCVEMIDPNIKMNFKAFLITDSFLHLARFVMCLFITSDINKMTSFMIKMFVLNMFGFVWTILGCVVFYNTAFCSCDYDVKTYGCVYLSLLISALSNSRYSYTYNSDGITSTTSVNIGTISMHENIQI